MAKKTKLVKDQSIECLAELIKKGHSLVDVMLDRMEFKRDEIDCLEDVMEYLTSAKERFGEVF